MSSTLCADIVHLTEELVQLDSHLPHTSPHTSPTPPPTPPHASPTPPTHPPHTSIHTSLPPPPTPLFTPRSHLPHTSIHTSHPPPPTPLFTSRSHLPHTSIHTSLAGRRAAHRRGVVDHRCDCGGGAAARTRGRNAPESLQRPRGQVRRRRHPRVDAGLAPLYLYELFSLYSIFFVSRSSDGLRGVCLGSARAPRWTGVLPCPLSAHPRFRTRTSPTLNHTHPPHAPPPTRAPPHHIHPLPSPGALRPCPPDTPQLTNIPGWDYNLE